MAPTLERFGSSLLTRTAPKLLAGVQADRFGLHVEQADVHAARLSGQTGAALNGHELAAVGDADATAEKQIDLAAPAHGEEPAVFEEERPLFREVQVESRQVDLLLVHLDLREVGVVGEVEIQARRHADLPVDAPVGAVYRSRSVAGVKFRLAEPIAYGINFKLRGAATSRSRSSPADDSRVMLYTRATGDQYTCSRFRSMVRAKLTPHTCGGGPYRSVRSGIMNSAVHPVSVMCVFTSQLPSQLTFKPPPDPPAFVRVAGRAARRVSPSLRTCASYWRPTAFVPKMNPLWRSW